jgi:hypothetical protein
VTDQITDQFSLTESESLALTLTKLSLMETDLEGDPDHPDRIVKRAVVRRYSALVAERLGVAEPGDGAKQLSWLEARGAASAVYREGENLTELLAGLLGPLADDARRYVLTSPDGRPLLSRPSRSADEH